MLQKLLFFWSIMTTVGLSYRNPLRFVKASTGKRTHEGDDKILLQVLRGQKAPRTPVWLLRQAGRYLPEFRIYSDKIPFRQRTETPSIAAELSLQPWRRYGLDGVIMFSDILTPLPAMGINYNIEAGKGPVIDNPVCSTADLSRLVPLTHIDSQVPFLKPLLQTLRREISNKSTLIGFVGAPWTLSAYSVEGGKSKTCGTIKAMMLEAKRSGRGEAYGSEAEGGKVLLSLLDHITQSISRYAEYQIECGAEVIQIFESWAHHLSEEQFDLFAKPYVNRICRQLKQKYPHVPVVYYANGGSSYLSSQLDLETNALSLDWHISMESARRITGPDKILAGNIDPAVLVHGTRADIVRAVQGCIAQAGQTKHVLNLGHGVEMDTPVDSVQHLIEAARACDLRS